MNNVLIKLKKTGLTFSDKSKVLLKKMLDIFVDKKYNKEDTLLELRKLTSFGDSSKKIYLQAMDFYLEEVKKNESIG